MSILIENSAILNKPKLAVTICATDSYVYAMNAQARALHANLRHILYPILFILVGGDKLKWVAELYISLFKNFAPGFEIERIAGFKETEGAQNYKNTAQLLIAQMRTAGFTAARARGATICWSVDSDVIPKSANCFATLNWMLDMPGDFYQVAISPYPSQGGGDMLTGRGSPEHPIFQDFQPEERIIPDPLQQRLDAQKAAFAELKGATIPKILLDEAQALYKAVDECPPKGNVFEISGKNGWRRRGWFSQAFPALGRGVIAPTDWCGFGCTLMNERALDEADLTGYEGAGTEDLFVVWNRWHQNGLRIGSAIHEPSCHVSRRSDGKFFMTWPRFVTEADESKGEFVGHLRLINRPFYAQDRGEIFNPANDGTPDGPKLTSAPGPPAPPAGAQSDPPASPAGA